MGEASKKATAESFETPVSFRVLPHLGLTCATNLRKQSHPSEVPNGSVIFLAVATTRLEVRA